jgi:hypothetical protein
MPDTLTLNVMVFPTAVGISQVVCVVTVIAGVDCPAVPGKVSLVSLKTTCAAAGFEPPAYVNVSEAG